MILTCPQCTMRYLLPASVLAPDGRNVKCSSCDEVWHQEPDQDELNGGEPATLPDDEGGEENFLDFVDIPEGVKPDVNLDDILSDDDEEGESASSFDIKATLGGFIAASLVFFLIFSTLAAFKSSIVSAWPPSAAFYQMFGMSVDVPGEGLVFDRVKAKVESTDNDHEDIIISGQIINLVNKDAKLPMIEASLRDKSGDVLEHWLVDMPEDTIPAEETLRFMQNYKASHKGAHELVLRFVLKGAKESKTVLEDDDNTHAPHQDDHAPQRGDEAAPESHAPASAPHH